MTWAELQNLEINNAARWPWVARVVLFLLLVVAIAVLGYFFIIEDQQKSLQRVQREEPQLQVQFEVKQRKAANLDAYRTQVADMQRSFGGMLRQLPNRSEIASLLQDVSQTRLLSGLEEQLFKPDQEVPLDFYAELPIKIRLVGSFHEYGQFAGGVAALPRIVTLHDINIAYQKQREAPPLLVMEATAKTYRYLDEDEQAEQQQLREKASNNKQRARR